MRRLYSLGILLFLLSLAPSASAQFQRAYGFCQVGGQNVVLSGLTQSSPPAVMASYPSCTITVYQQGTVTLATIYQDSGGTTPLSNPFTAQSNGYWDFYAANARYDVTESGGGLSTPFTFGDILLGAGGGGGGGGTTITINGAAVASTVNFNNSTPAPDAGYNAVIWKYSGGQAIAEYQPGGGGGGGSNPCFTTPNSLQVGGSVSVFNCASNLTWLSGTLTANQFSNGTDLVDGARSTDSGTTGNIFHFTGNGGTTLLFGVDWLGNENLLSSQTIGSSATQGTQNIGQSGTLGLNVIHGGSAVSNTQPGCQGITTSPNDTALIYICASSLGLPFVVTGSPAASDSSNVLAPVNTVQYETATYTVNVVNDRENWFVITCASACNFNLPVAGSTGAPAGWKASVINLGAGTVTITPTGPSTINGISTLPIVTNSSTSFKSDGVGNYAATIGGSGGGAGGGVSSVGLTVPAGSLFGVTGSPVTSSGSLGLTTIGTSGGIPCFTTTSTLNSSALLPSGSILIGGGAGLCPTTVTNLTFSANTLGLPLSSTILFNNAALDTLVSAATTGLTFSGIFTAQGFVGGNTGAAAFDAFGQGTAPTSFTANAVTFYSAASISTPFGIIWPSAIGTSGQVMQISAINTVASTQVATLSWAGSSGTVNNCATAGGVAYYSSTGTAISCLASVIEAPGNLTLGVLGTTAGVLTLNGSTSGASNIELQATGGSFTYKMPNTTPSVNQNLYVANITGSVVTFGYQNNGSGGGSGCVPSGTANLILLDSGSGSCTDSTTSLVSGLLTLPAGGGLVISNSSQTGSMTNAPCVAQFSTSDTLTNSVTTEQFFATTCEIPANSLGAGKVLHYAIGADFTSPASAPTVTFRSYLCTVSGCATGSKILLYQSVTAVPGATTSATSGGAQFMLQGQASPGSSVAISSTIFAAPGVGSTLAPFTKNVNLTNVTGTPTNTNTWLSFSIQYSNTTNATSLSLTQLVTEWQF